jgi:hypothetical protein
LRSPPKNIGNFNLLYLIQFIFSITILLYFLYFFDIFISTQKIFFNFPFNRIIINLLNTKKYLLQKGLFLKKLQTTLVKRLDFKAEHVVIPLPINESDGNDA